MNSYRNEYTLTNAIQAWFADNATGATIALANNATPDGYAYKPAIKNNGSNDLSGIDFTFTGLDADGKTQIAVVAGPGASSTVYTDKEYFSYISSVTLSSTLGSNTVDIGTSGFFASKTYPLASDKTASIALDLIDGSINYTGQCSYNDVSVTQPPYLWQNLTSPGQDFYQKIASDNLFLLSPPNAFRIITSSFSTPNFVFSIINNFARN